MAKVNEEKGGCQYVSDQPAPICEISKVDELILTHENDWPYFACCDVSLQDGSIEFLECKIPE